MVIGDCNPDIILRGDDVRPEFGQHEKLVTEAGLVVGGSASITACACARAGLRTAFVGATGDDIFGRFMLEKLGEWGVGTGLCPVLAGETTGFSVVLSAGQDRAILTHLGTIDRLAPEHLPVEGLARARHVHISSYFLQPRLAALLPGLARALKQRGVTVSVDPNWDPSERWDGGLASLLEVVDVFLPNAAEAKALSGCGETGAAALALARRGPLVVVKGGAEGAVAAMGAELLAQPVFPVPVVDTTGAGDAFNAGFLTAWLDGLAVAECLRYGCGAGALSTRALGATGALASVEEIRELIGSVP